jgi:hypothetical protein
MGLRPDIELQLKGGARVRRFRYNLLPSGERGGFDPGADGQVGVDLQAGGARDLDVLPRPAEGPLSPIMAVALVEL